MLGDTLRPAALLATVLMLAGAGCSANGLDMSAVGTTMRQAVVCAPGPTTFGIDVSRYQGDINWSLVAGADVKFAYIQISRKIDDIDAKFEVNWEQAKTAGILRGAYQRFQPDEDVLGQAELFLDKLGPFEPGDLPPMLDVEDDGGLPASVIADRVRQWLVHVEEELGVRPIIYTGRYFWEGNLESADFTDYPLWIAHYTNDCPNIPAPWNNWALHQYSSQAMIAGITANTVDVNYFNGTVDDLLALSCGDACEPCQRIAGQGGIIDDSGSCFVGGGNPAYLRKESEGHGDTLTWTNTTDSESASNYGRWKLHFEEEGRYAVDVHTPSPWAMSTRAVYQIFHAGESTAVEIDQSLADGWVPLGTFEFAAGGEQSIRLDDNTGEPNATMTKLVFDAARVTRIEEPADDADPAPPASEQEEDEQEGNEGSGCRVAASGQRWPDSALLLLVLVVLLRRPKNKHLSHNERQSGAVA